MLQSEYQPKEILTFSDENENESSFKISYILFLTRGSLK